MSFKKFLNNSCCISKMIRFLLVLQISTLHTFLICSFNNLFDNRIPFKIGRINFFGLIFRVVI